MKPKKPPMTPEERELRSQAATPQSFFDGYHKKHDFTVDACAVAWNAKLLRYWSLEQDGLRQNWGGERLWINPPYGKGLILPWVRRVLNTPSCGAALLLPARTDTDWFQDLWKSHLKHQVVFHWHRGRLHFDAPPGIKYSSPNERHFIALVRL